MVFQEEEVVTDILGDFFAGFAFATFLWFWVIFNVILVIVLAVWLYRDARDRNMNAAIWLVFIFIFGIIALIVYFVVRRDYPRKGRRRTSRQVKPRSK
jgi:hypothetical protein